MEDFASWMSIKEEKTEDKSLCVSVKIEDKHLNGHGTGHGGFLYAICAQAIWIYMSRIERNGVGMEGSVHYYRPAQPGDTLYAYVTERKVGKRVGIFLIELKNQDGKLIVDTMMETMFSE